MRISQLTFIVTDDCNYNCSYCLQTKENRTISKESIKKAIDFFYPLFRSNHQIQINFYGGEPLLAYDRIKTAVQWLLKKNKNCPTRIQFTLTTNGSLLSEEKLFFFNRLNFQLILSFDGVAQEISRKRGSLDRILHWIKRIEEYPSIAFEINSVFSPQTVHLLAESLIFIIRQGGSNITFNLSSHQEWEPTKILILKNELLKLKAFSVHYYRETKKIPVTNFRFPGSVSTANPGVFRCNAGLDRIAITPEERLWGCFLFHDYFKTRKDHPQYQDFYLGTLDEFIKHHKNDRNDISKKNSQLPSLGPGFFPGGREVLFPLSGYEGLYDLPGVRGVSNRCIGKDFWHSM